MDWCQFIIFCVGVLGMFFWNRSESRADHRESRTEMRALEAWTKEMLMAIQQEMKDFHGRLCALEEKGKKEITWKNFIRP